jgi:glutamate N-acetyltransferase/amino-acid N-acetyltransferase
MGTMLSFIATDAPITAPALQAVLARATERSFNCITVDGDTSTSDTALAFATGAAAAQGAPLIADARDPRLRAFVQAFQAVSTDLAQQIARDGEGAQKFVTVTVRGATGDASARRIARAIANSPLVKTAIAGADANWGRVVMAVGKAGEPADRDKLAIWFGDTCVAKDGMRAPDYDEAAVTAYMKGREIALMVDLGLGRGHATMWTCDLTAGYIAINADYRS